ncbi:MAG: hypothetical protein SNJ82_01080 [Gemmataceae bacterium]
MMNEGTYPRWEDTNMTTSEVIEIPLLLSVGQVSALERVAHQRGLTAGEMVRQVLRDFIVNAK